MLSPDTLQDAGDAVAALYSDMEAKMLDHLVDALINVDRLGQKSMTELNLLAQSMTSDLRRIIKDNREAIADEVYETCEKLLSASDRDDAKRLGVEDVTFPQQLTATVTGLQMVLDRDNLKMMEGAKQAFLKASVEAVTMANSGLYTSDQAIHRAVRNLTTGGISVTEVTYQNPKTGAVTVTNKVDVAVRRHVRTQIAQDSGRMTLDRLKQMDVALVEVSNHEGSRPSHAEWQGRCYSLKGEVVIEGKRYPDFWTSCHWGDLADGIDGVNCRHSFGPYRHGAPRAYEPDPKHPSGLSNDEVYKLSQKQRYRECQIRAAKRDVMGAQRIYEKDASLSNRTNLLQAQQRLKNRQAAMRTFIKDANAKCKPGTTVLHRNPRREWAGDMPKVKSRAALVAEGKVTKKGTANQYSVKRRVVNGEAYKERIKQLGLPKKASETIHQQALRILEDTDGTQHERLCAIAWKTGEPITDTFAQAPVNSACGFTPEQVAKIRDVEGGVILLHNHPGSSVPSATDIMTLANNDWCRASVIACHDGTLYMPRILKDGVTEAYNAILSDVKRANPSIPDSGALEQIAQEVFYFENEDDRWFKLTKK